MKWRIVPIIGHCEYSEEIKEFARNVALKAALEVRSELVDCEIDYIKRLGHKWEARFLSAYGALRRRFGGKVDDLILLADRMDIYTTQYEASLRFKAMKLSVSNIEQKDLKLTTFESCEKDTLCGALLAQHYSEACRNELLESISAKGFPSTGAILEAISVNKLMQAALCIADNQQKSLDLLADSVNSMSLSTQGEMHLESFFARKNDRSVNARKAANVKKAKYQPLKELAATLVNAKNFKSRRNAAQTITSEIVAESEKLGIALSKNQAEITITGWLKEMGLPANI